MHSRGCDEPPQARAGRTNATMAWLFALHEDPRVVMRNSRSPYAQAQRSALPGTPVACAEDAGMPCARRRDET